MPSNLVWALAPDTQGGLWIGTSGGLVKSDGATWTVYTTANSPLPSNEIIRLAMDARGVLWIGTYQGLARFDGTTWIVYTTKNSPLPSNRVQALHTDAGGTLWVGTDGGLARLDGVSWMVYGTTPSEVPGQMDIYALAVDAQGTLWIGTTSGSLVKFDGQAWIVYDWRNSRLYPDNRIFALSTDKQGNLWMGVEETGLVRFDGVNWTVFGSRSVSLGTAFAFAIGVHGALWSGGNNGLAKFDGATWMVYTAANSGLPDKGVSALTFDAHGNLWIGTFDGGLAIYRERGVILTGVEEDRHTETPSAFTLARNTPNPFNAATTIPFSVPVHSRVKVTVYDVVGQHVCDLVDQVYMPGVYRVVWGGTNRAQIPVPSGVYVYRMTTHSGILTRKLVVVR